MNRLVEIIRSEVEKAGAISFARFMELALYCPVYGYYEKETDTIGRRGDYITSVSVGNLFGELLAFRFADWLTDIDDTGGENQKSTSTGKRPALSCVVEAGAHDGRLAMDILSWLRRHRRALFERLQYCVVEPSPLRRSQQKEMLAEFRDRVRWVAELQELPAGCPNGAVRGIIFSNELLDAMPAHRLGWDARSGSWFEWGVSLKNETFAWVRMACAQGMLVDAAATWLAELPEDLSRILPDGFTTDFCPAAARWWSNAASILQRGKLLTIDYGLAAEEFFSPERSQGTVRAYRRHHLSHELLAEPGEQDLTAQVNFTSIQNAGEVAGLTTEAFLYQDTFLTKIAERIWSEPARFGEWNPAKTRQFQTLTHPEQLGRSFRVLLQARDS